MTFYQTERAKERRYRSLIQKLSAEIKLNGGDTPLALRLQQQLTQLATPPAPHPYAKSVAVSGRQRTRAALRSVWYGCQTLKEPRKERRQGARAGAAGIWRKRKEYGEAGIRTKATALARSIRRSWRKAAA